MSENEVICKVKSYRKRLLLFSEQPGKEKEILHVLKKLKKIEMTLKVLKETSIGLTVNKFKSNDNEIRTLAASLVVRWKAVVSQTCANLSSNTSQERKADSVRNDVKKAKSSENVRSSLMSPTNYSQSSSSPKKSKSRNQTNASYSDNSIITKDFPASSSSKINGSLVELNKNHKNSIKRIKMDKCKNNTKQIHCSNDFSVNDGKKMNTKLSHQTNTENHTLKQLEHNCISDKMTFQKPISSAKQYDQKYRLNQDEDSDIEEGINNNAGVSFADLMAYKPSTPQKKKTVKQSRSFIQKPVDSSLLDDSILEDLDQEINSSSQYISGLSTSVNTEERTVDALDDMVAGLRRYSERKLYTGRKSHHTRFVESLVQCCQNVLLQNFDAIEGVGLIPCELLDPILNRVTPFQLENFEQYNEHLQEDTDKYWQKHLKAQFPQEKFPERKFGWKKLYKKLLSERERKLNRTTESIISKMNQKQQQVSRMEVLHTTPVHRKRTQRAQVQNFKSPPPSNSKSKLMQKLLTNLKKRR